MSFIKDKFRFIHRTPRYSDTKEIIALGEYRGKIVKGVAKCDPRDAFDPEVGEELAARRCNVKIAEKRLATRHSQYDKLIKEARVLASKISKAESYVEYAEKEHLEAVNLLNEFMDKI